jgi:nitrate reductase cytochrome c-type subunit
LYLPIPTFATYFKQKKSNKMKKITTAALALMFIGSVAIAQDKKEAPKKDAPKKEKAAKKADKKEAKKEDKKEEKKAK